MVMSLQMVMFAYGGVDFAGLTGEIVDVGRAAGVHGVGVGNAGGAGRRRIDRGELLRRGRLAPAVDIDDEAVGIGRKQQNAQPSDQT